MKHLFQRQEDGSWKDLGRPDVLSEFKDLSEEEIVHVMNRMASARGADGPVVELREVPSGTEVSGR